MDVPLVNKDTYIHGENGDTTYLICLICDVLSCIEKYIGHYLYFIIPLQNVWPMNNTIQYNHLYMYV